MIIDREHIKECYPILHCLKLDILILSLEIRRKGFILPDSPQWSVPVEANFGGMFGIIIVVKIIIVIIIHFI